MRKSITNTLAEAKSKLNAYSALLSYRYANLCVKADARALLPVTVKIDAAELNIEKVALVSNPQEDQFAIYPKDQMNIPQIVQGVKQAHPEFKMEVKNWDDYPEQFKEDKDEEYKYILFTMPEINKSRRDLLNQGVDLLHDQWDAKCKAIKADCAARLTKYVASEGKEATDAVLEKLDDLYKTYHDYGEGETENKKKEIEDGYQRYLTNEAQEEATQKARGENAGSSMKMTQDDSEDDY